jgi:hypothetical protein
MSSTSAADARSHAVVPVSISSGVIVASFGDGNWKRAGSLRRLDPGTPEVTQNSASCVLRQTCLRLHPGHSCHANVTAMFRPSLPELVANGKKFGRIGVIRDHFRGERRAGRSFAELFSLTARRPAERPRPRQPCRRPYDASSNQDRAQRDHRSPQCVLGLLRVVGGSQV